MALYRNVNMGFWTDTKVVDDYTPEDKLFMLYALTNEYTNLVGCYEISLKQIANDLGYNKETIESLLKRFIELHKTIDYDFETKELLVKNWNKYNWSSSPKLAISLKDCISRVKSDNFKNYLINIYNETIKDLEEYDTLCIPYAYHIDTTNSNSNRNSNSNSNSNIKENIKRKYFENEEVENVFNEYLQLRKKLKMVNTDRAIKMLINKLEPYSDDIKIKMLEQSIEHSWKTVYEVKQENVPKWFNQEIKKEEIILTEEEQEYYEKATGHRYQ